MSEEKKKLPPAEQTELEHKIRKQLIADGVIVPANPEKEPL